GGRFRFAPACKQYRKWKFRHHFSNIEQHRKASPFELQLFGKRKRRRLNFFCFQRLHSSRAVADPIQNLIVPVSYESLSTQALDRSKLGDAARTSDSNNLASQIVQAPDLLRAQ